MIYRLSQHAFLLEGGRGRGLKRERGRGRGGERGGGGGGRGEKYGKWDGVGIERDC